MIPRKSQGGGRPVTRVREDRVKRDVEGISPIRGEDRPQRGTSSLVGPIVEDRVGDGEPG